MREDRIKQQFYAMFEEAPRQGPGSLETTRRALSLCRGLPEKPEILDLGCGSGVPSLELARLTGGRVTALDNHRPFLDRLESKARAQGLDGRVKAVLGDMREPPFPDAAFDLVWSEGAAYIMGYDVALAAWKRLVKPGCCLAISELVWFRPDAPEACRAYWDKALAGLTPLRFAEEHVASAKALGYELVDRFSLEGRCWSEEYFAPLVPIIGAMEAANPGEPETLAVTGEMREELAMYDAHGAYYGYEFLILRRPA